MIVAREVLGNVDGMVEARDVHEERGTLETVAVSERERNRSRFKTELDDGTELGVVLGDRELSPGDERREALVVSVPEMGWQEALELGHHVGNQHWELAIRDTDLLIPITGERRLMERTLREELPEGAAIEVEEVDPELFDDADHDHGHGHDADHGHDHDHLHDHTSGEHG